MWVWREVWQSVLSKGVQDTEVDGAGGWVVGYELAVTGGSIGSCGCDDWDSMNQIGGCERLTEGE